MSSGIRLNSYRQGDRSEYLALYLLSGLGLVTQVPRQEDIGVDFVCSIADNETNLLTFSDQYAVSVKSKGSSQSVDITPVPSWDGLEPIHLDWFFGLDLPLLLAIVDRKKDSISLFSTLSAWFIHYDTERFNCGSISLCPRDEGASSDDIGLPIKRDELKDFPANTIMILIWATQSSRFLQQI